jgi:hypothetical protein
MVMELLIKMNVVCVERKDVWEYTCDEIYIVWMLWYYENSVVDRW